MPRKPKPKNTLTAGERVALYEAEKEKRMQSLSVASEDVENNSGKVNESEIDVKVEKTVDAKPKKQKPKPQSATVRVDFSVSLGKVKPMHGMCNGPVSYGADLSDSFKEIGVPTVRFDCTDTAISRQAIDISRIFRDPDADPSDPDNYDFSCTDKYVDAAMLAGAGIIYRLGESRDLFGTQAAKTITDVDVLARVCVNVIRHYNDGWAQGRYYGIKYFELLSLVENSEDLSDIMTLYGRLANAIKLYDEEIKVGGMSFDDFSTARELIKTAKRNRFPLDFITVDCFCGDPLQIKDRLDGLNAYAKNLGFEDIEIIIGKWFFADEDVLCGESPRKIFSSDGDEFKRKRREIFCSQRSVKGAAYCAALMLSLDQTEGAHGACFYDAQPMISPFCALTDRFGDAEKPFYAFKAFGELYRAGTKVLCSVDSPEEYAHSGIYCSAARSDSGEGFVMIASFGGCGVVDLRLDGISENIYSADVYMLDGVKNMTLVDSAPVSGLKKRIVLNVSEYGAVLVKLY